MIFYGELPNASQLDDYRSVLKANRKLPDTLLEVLERIPASAHPMDVMRTGCSMLGNLEPEGDFANQQTVANRLLGALPGIINYWYRYSHDAVRSIPIPKRTRLRAIFCRRLPVQSLANCINALWMCR